MSDSPVNINCDLGEGMHNEEVIMPLIQSCNIACGGHAGDEETMKRVVALAKAHHVAIGAHPSYPDRENFGRVSVHMPAEELKKALKKQLEDFEQALEQNKARLHHIKAHGALYNDLAKDPDLVATYLDVVEKYKDIAMLYVPYDSVIQKKAISRGFSVAIEAFGDRNYTETLKLVSRKLPNALITEKEKVLDHIRAISKGKVVTETGKELPIQADTICIHSDTENAVAILHYLNEHMNS
ncbi:5-oxoprolinase subunit PxpA [Robertkochia marina]|nr:5-oxoprolinase subunit PxpA [Robertkochia marina]